MKITLGWLKDHLDTAATAEKIVGALTRIGLEVESIEDKSKRLSAFTVARVVSAERHPNADKLKLCMVDTGKETVQLVCGAPNAHAGMKGVFAPPGTYIPGTGMMLKVAAIRGVESRGMLCSERELELSQEHEGIIELPEDAQVGTPAAEVLGLCDPVIDVAVTPNRGDCTGVHGIARDLAAAGIGNLKSEAVAKVAGKFKSPISVTLDFPKGKESACPMFAGRYVRGLKNGPSPQWLQQRLKAIGLRPISALVDITNFLSYDRGRPLHVFDAKKLKGNINARLAHKGEMLHALDGRVYELDPEMCVIADEGAARGIGGVMGGEETGCTESTTDVFVECALFDPVRIAETGRKLGIVSDARYRFERGVDPEFVLPGMELATRLILECCGGEPSEIVVAGRPTAWQRHIPFSLDHVRKLAGLALTRDEVAAILKRLGFAVEGGDAMRVTPPSWRADVQREADLVEEVVRIYGIEKVPHAPMPRVSAVAQPVLTHRQQRITIARRTLAARGFNETINFSFVPRAHAAFFGGGDEVRQLENPISAELDALRPSVLPSLLAAAARNQARGHAHLMLFEIGAQFASGKPGDQATMAAGLRAGAPTRHWMKNQTATDVFAAKADAMAVLEPAWGQAFAAPVQAGAAPWYHPGRSGTLALGPAMLAWFGELHPKIVSAFEIKGPAAAFEIFLDAIPDPKPREGRARTPLEASDLPAVERDFAFVVDTQVTAEQIVKAARTAERELIESVSVFDAYEGEGVPEEKKSIAVSVRLQPVKRTLTDAEIEEVAKKIVSAVAKATGGVLRG
ncbi:MAG: phenylalanine--tRNA ligase subunit beta [Alphaproteobacteria bacterium]